MTSDPFPSLDDFSGFVDPVHIVPKGKSEWVVLGVNEFHSRQYIDIRVYYLKDGEYRPSKEGVTIPIPRYLDLLKGVLELGGRLGAIEPSVLAQIDTAPADR